MTTMSFAVDILAVTMLLHAAYSTIQCLRTIGVITKLDIMDRGTDARNFLLGKVIPLRLGYIGAVNRSQEDALVDEEKFFRSCPVYNELADRCGVPHLAKKLNQILVQHIKTVLPGLKSRISYSLVYVAKEHASYREIIELVWELFFYTFNVLRRHCAGSCKKGVAFYGIGDYVVEQEKTRIWLGIFETTEDATSYQKNDERVYGSVGWIKIIVRGFLSLVQQIDRLILMMLSFVDYHEKPLYRCSMFKNFYMKKRNNVLHGRSCDTTPTLRPLSLGTSWIIGAAWEIWGKSIIWDEMAESFNKSILDTLEQPVIVAVSSCRVSKYKDYQFSATLATYHYLNPNIPEADQSRAD
ncbi:dynamin-related protein 3A-like protein [Tanacetum coccineum]|uniref:Dynamin-related protein 3A-like protein n=1 Tax=Tanacetum coccineum TaxID=301880 RepID=A0ABQ4WR81_9ASTR